ncbi:hypothetical protein CMUST_13645 [Corynebacterium mustelae]|uniref:Uncharacterized protein n=1 Tax=Corynebacterium mustelae TaxID=571915 RepID=A0A0G3H5B8_9CORY|nr:hypothetical protein [Corynebacterium mustelae]AKK07023.1 hypothetical protein CMUST_13645 [Corynebacterium mustelae]
MSFRDPFADPPKQQELHTGADYAYQVVGSSTVSRQHPPFAAVRMWDAPFIVKLAAAVYLLVACVMLWLLFNEFTTRSNARDLVVFIAVVIGIVNTIGAVGLLKARFWSRWLVSATSIIGFFYIVTSLWPLSLIGAVAGGMVWLPRNNAWFGQ